MAELVKYTDDFKKQTAIRIAAFFGFHSNLIMGQVELTERNFLEAEKTLTGWIDSANELYMIKNEQTIVGFLHIGYRGNNVAWIEDIYVDELYRNQGIATKSIQIAEDIIKSNPNYNAICLDVVPRNEQAIKLYHKLGYDNLSIITIRKELYDNRRNKREKLFGLDFKY